MLLNTWSYIYLVVSMISMIAIYVSLFTTLTVSKMLFVIVTWAGQLCFNLIYGIATQQMGFVVLFMFQFLFTMVVLLKYRKVANENNVTQ